MDKSSGRMDGDVQAVFLKRNEVSPTLEKE